LTTIDVNKIYIIGGLVDETVSKHVTLQKCSNLNLKSYSLPIEQYMTRRHSITQPNETIKTFNYNKILTINQVFNILTQVSINNNDWSSALHSNVPLRKGFEPIIKI
jgi:tRNA (guanine9-N1)-methyltransferase